MKALEIENKNNQTYPAFVPHNLVSSAEIDYITLRSIMVFCGSSILYSKITHNAADCLEKIMKAFLLKRSNISADDLRNKYGHNLEKIRQACAKLDQFFNDSSLKDFCDNYSGKKRGNEVLKYGFQDNTSQYGVNIGEVINLTDRIFLGSLVKLDDLNYFAATSQIATLLGLTIFSSSLLTTHTPLQVKNLQNSLWTGNIYLEGFINTVNKFNEKVKENDKKK